MNNSNAIEIILIEDNDYDAELTTRALKKHLSNTIRRFSDGQEALDYFFPPDASSDPVIQKSQKLILLDLKLPFVSGLDVLKIIKSDPRTKSIPVVVLTSSTEEQDIIESYQLGVNSYIVKPVEFENFMDSIQKLGLYWLLVNRYPQQ